VDNAVETSIEVESPKQVRFEIATRIDYLSLLPAIVARIVGNGARATSSIRGNFGHQRRWFSPSSTRDRTLAHKPARSRI